ncbi:MAG TPA: biotin carboxylase N-terminal domain-containing protein [Hyphomicrobiaceae bacterium]|nr:biotin carboxylase N-terminal domain-containing protein [Hyphomicrobiaceae bacterium]
MGAFRKVLVANRGAVAARVLRALAEMKIPSVAVYSDADAGAPYLALASETARIGAAPARESYLNQDALIAAIEATKADGVHPGYGFLAENAEFARRVIGAGVTFIGPSPTWIDAMGHKARARELAARYGFPLAPASGVLGRDPAEIRQAAERIGYPVLVKPAGGGGGIGMLAAESPVELIAVVERAGVLAQRSFGTDEIYLEKLVRRPRHVEIQLLGDKHGQVAALFERDCSMQRRHQKVIEEAPAPGIARERVGALMAAVADKLGTAGYDNLGTVEMLMDGDGRFMFLEMNTRLQVEHGVTEEVTGIDLVRAQIRAAAGERLADILASRPVIDGHAIQARVYAEDPKRFFPSPGRLTVFRPPCEGGVRVETGYAEGGEVTPHYDPLLAKVIVHRPTRESARIALIEALDAFHVEGIKTNIPALRLALESEEFCAGRPHTELLSEIVNRAPRARSQAVQ